MVLLNRADIENALNLLLEELSKSNEESAIYVIGGAAINLAYNEKRATTTDVDVKITNPDVVIKAAEQVGNQLNLPADWLNTEAVGYLSTQNQPTDWILWKASGKASIYIAAPEMLLTMKLKASRLGRDGDDIWDLLNRVDPQTINDIDSLFDRYFPGETYPSQATELINDWFQEFRGFKPIA